MKIDDWNNIADSTLEYIQGVQKESVLEGVPSNGLICATVLIGVYCQSTGIPILGVINQPFHRKVDDRYIFKKK